jgi:hypothetical protein
MKEFLIKLKLIDYLNVELPINKELFTVKLTSIVDKKGFVFFEAFSKSKNEYCGEVNIDSFELRRRRIFMDTNQNLTKAKGNISGEPNKTVIHTEINGFNIIMVLPLILMIVFFSTSMMITQSDEILILAPILITFFILFTILIYFFVRRNVEKFKYDLERELFYLTKK